MLSIVSIMLLLVVVVVVVAISIPTLAFAESWYQVNRGEVEGYNGIPATSKNPDYISGYQQGVAYRNATFTDRGPTIPAESTDNYKQFYIVYHDGQIREDLDYAHNSLHFHSCPLVTTKGQEYCAGFTAGYDEENWIQDVVG
jgi:hypothetical protein